ncbi:ribosomal protein L5 domain-containing protein [Tuber indicum]|nr:ribosomal protein L5 domain-containing protein [Tuber indicum]
MSSAFRRLQIKQSVLNIREGECGERFTRAAKVSAQPSGQTPAYIQVRYTVRSFGICRNENIAVHFNVRGPKAEEIIQRGLKRSLSKTVNFCFGISEHNGLGVKSDPVLCMYAMDFNCIIIGTSHRINQADCIKWFKAKYDATVT